MFDPYYDQALFMATLFSELEDSIKVLLQQRQSSKRAFEAGWQGFYRDLLTRLDEDEKARLRAIFDHMNDVEDDSEIPF